MPPRLLVGLILSALLLGCRATAASFNACQNSSQIMVVCPQTITELSSPTWSGSHIFLQDIVAPNIGGSVFPTYSATTATITQALGVGGVGLPAFGLAVKATGAGTDPAFLIRNASNGDLFVEQENGVAVQYGHMGVGFFSLPAQAPTATLDVRAVGASATFKIEESFASSLNIDNSVMNWTDSSADPEVSIHVIRGAPVTSTMRLSNDQQGTHLGLVISGTGVGVDNMTPTSALDVTGTVKATGVEVNGTNIVYYCSGSTAGTFDGNLARGNSNAGACAGGTWTATSLKVD